MRTTKQAMLEGVTGVESARIIGNNTLEVHYTDGRVAVRLHKTDVVTRMADGSTILDSGGWRTPTTKGRINDAIPRGWHVWAEKGTWYLYDRSGKSGGETYASATRHVFEDGITIHPDGTVTGAGMAPDKGVLKAAMAYSKAYMAAMAAGEVPAPSAGDCWYCHLVTDDGRSMGEVNKDPEHIRAHIRERYYVPSLLVRAVKRFTVSPVAMGWIEGLWYGEESGAGAIARGIKGGDWVNGIAVSQCQKALYRYLKAQLGFAA